MAPMTWCLFQIQTYKTKRWTVFLWIYVLAGIVLAFPLALGQWLLEGLRQWRVRWTDPAAF